MVTGKQKGEDQRPKTQGNSTEHRAAADRAALH
jgi:hypothetical protein